MNGDGRYSARCFSVALLVVMVLLWGGCSDERLVNEASEVLPLRIAIPHQPGSVLALVAAEAGFFEAAGLAPRYSVHPSGKRALQEALLPGKTDVAFTSDLPAVELLFRGEDILIIAAVQSVRSVNAIVGRRDRGIEEVADLRGRTVGVQPISAVHYFLDCTLAAHSVDQRTVDVRAMTIEELVPALVAGDLDAISIREPYLTEAMHRLGSRSLVMRAPWVYPQFELVVARRSFVEKHPLELTRLIRALLRTERFLREEPDRSAMMLADVLGLDVNESRVILRETINRVELPQSIVLHLEEQFRWLEEQTRGGKDMAGKTATTETPITPLMDILAVIHPDLLGAIQYERVDVAGFGYLGREE
jgi:sulfonate transport system substrate-binding protein